MIFLVFSMNITECNGYFLSFIRACVVIVMSSNEMTL